MCRYEHMVYDGEMIRIATLPGMWDRCGEKEKEV